MNINSIAKRALELLGLLMIGEGVTGLLEPKRYSLFWKVGPKWHRNIVETIAEHPEITRGVCAVEIAAGIWLALREIERT